VVLLNKHVLVLSIIALLWAGVCRADEAEQVPAADQAQEPQSSLLLSAIHMWIGQRLLEAGNAEEAGEHFLTASRYLRTSPEPHFALARVYLRRSAMDAFLEFAIGVKLMLSDFLYQSLLVSNLIVILLIAAGLTIYTGAAIVVAKHARTVWHSVMITLSPSLRGWYLKAIVIGCILSFFVTLSGRSLIGVATWTLLVGAALCWRFASSSERRALIGLVVYLALFGLLLDGTTRVISTQHPDSQVRLAAMVGRIEDQALQVGMDKAGASPQFDPIDEFMQGLMAIKNRRYARAVEHFNIASKFAPENPAILNNLGVAFDGLGQYDQAVVKFKEALRYGPREALIHYNYAQTLNSMIQYDLAQEELAKASTLDFDLTRSLVTEKGDSRLVPMNLQTRILWRLALEEENKTATISYNPVESGPAGIVVLATIAVTILVLMRRTKVPARCDVCGTTVQSQIARRRRKEFLCSECHRIRETGTTNQSVEEDLERRIRKRDTREAVKRIVLGLIVPGSAYYVSGKRSKGLALAFVIFTFLIIAVANGAVIEPIPNFGVHPLSGWPLPLFLIIYALYCWRSTVTAIRSVQEAG
jgi:tetratricopeptide (TPR) repeat protein